MDSSCIDSQLFVRQRGRSVGFDHCLAPLLSLLCKNKHLNKLAVGRNANLRSRWVFRLFLTKLSRQFITVIIVIFVGHYVNFIREGSNEAYIKFDVGDFCRIEQLIARKLNCSKSRLLVNSETNVNAVFCFADIRSFVFSVDATDEVWKNVHRCDGDWL